MAFFQNSVINKYIQTLDKQTLQNAYAKFRAHFHNATIQENIRGSKEEQYQGEFLIDLFVTILGYTKNPTPNFNLTTEYKNVKDSKKADGAIIINDVVKAVIELKGTNTTDLNKIEVQAFGYKNNQPECEYVITSNFEKIRFYIDNAIEYTEFNLFTLTEKEFELLYICLSFESIAKGLPRQIKDESVSQESLITKKLYNDYSQFKNELYHSLVKLNPQYEALELFKKSQKLLDRFLFIFFAEDRQLLPTNLIFRINKEWQQLRNMRIEVSLYDRYKIYFNDLDCGATVSLPAFSQTASKQVEEFQIYAYNGGLFKTDDLLNDIKIEDELLFAHTEKLSNYDFASEVDVNVLGHIFENSLNDLDEIKAQLEGQEIDKTKTKRKKDGVFYTPKYITKYIVDNTVGKLCLEKKETLQLVESDYTIDKKRQKKTTQDLTDKLNEYRNWLLQLTICDPACGSGAFLNQALDFLITEHKYIDELQAKLFGDALVLSDVEGSILENNLFGVDINEESVEIAKLSLWLRTAQPNRKLNDLNSNIKCGNSLIDDVAIAGDKAFNWQKEFKKIFDKGGFDVIIGNPPYSYRNTISNVEKKFFENNYISYEGNFDLYKFFIEKGLVLSKTQGLFSFITSSSFLIQTSFKKLRKLMLTNNDLIELIPLGPSVFEDATVDTAIFIIKKESNSNFIKIGNPKNSFDILKRDFRIINKTRFSENKDFIFDCNLSDDAFNFLSKLEETYSKMEDCFDLGVGINTGYIKDELVSKRQINEKYHPMVPGTGISRYGKCVSEEWIMYDKDFVKSKGDRGRALPLEKYFTSDKILVVRTRNLSMKRRIVATFDNEKKYNLNRLSNIIAQGNNSLLGVLAVLNSSFYNWLFSTKYLDYEIKPVYLKKCPIPNINDKNLIDKSKLILMLNKELTELEDKFIRSLQRKFSLSSLSKKLQEFYSISYSDFIKELAKKKIKLSLADEAEWEEYFNTESKKALELKSKIDTTDKEIDQMVYKLYDLTEEEIKIVEKS
jgi:type I restriction-modification system DNA methylase subunit